MICASVGASENEVTSSIPIEQLLTDLRPSGSWLFTCMIGNVLFVHKPVNCSISCYQVVSTYVVARKLFNYGVYIIQIATRVVEHRMNYDGINPAGVVL